MKQGILLSLLFLLPVTLWAQRKPTYCEEIPATYDKTVAAKPALPQFGTTPTTEYKVQVAILKFTQPKDYPFHPKLVARYRPCEEVWVVESRQLCRTRADAERLRQELRGLGYTGAYITEVVAYR